jgi:hypothetical protein
VLAESKQNPGRYLPLEKWKSLLPSERKATDAKKKREGKGKQYVANTEKAKVKSSAKYYADDTNEIDDIDDIDDYLIEFDL